MSAVTGSGTSPGIGYTPSLRRCGVSWVLKRRVMMFATSSKFSRSISSSNRFLRSDSLTIVAGIIVNDAPSDAASARSAISATPTSPSSPTKSATAPTVSSSSSRRDVLSIETDRPTRSISRSRIASWIGIGYLVGMVPRGVSDDAVQELLEGLSRERLGEEGLGAGGDRGFAHRRLRLGGDEPERHVGSLGPEDLQELDAVHLGHVPVAQNEHRLLVRDELEGLRTVLGLEELRVRLDLAHVALDDHPHRPAVVDDEDLHLFVPPVQAADACESRSW